MADKDAPDFSDLAGGDEVSIDGKGRILVSKDLRESIKEPFVLGRGSVGCLVVYPKARWDALMEIVDAVDEYDPARQTYERLMVGGVQKKMRFDSAGRMLVPRDLRAFAKLPEGGKVRLVGMRQRVEVWSSTEFERYQEDPDNYNKARREAVDNAYRDMTRRG